MNIAVRPCASVEELRGALNVISHYFGHESSAEDAEHFAQWIDLGRVHAAFDGDRIVGGAGAFTYRMSVPGGGEVPAAGVTVVGVLPTFRRRGVLTSMMNAQLDDCRRRGDFVAYLWASESAIYGRFGYGLASQIGSMKLARERSNFAQPFEQQGTVRLVDLEEAARSFPALYEELRPQRPGMFSRSKEWWETRKLFDDPARRQGGPLNRALLELDGEPAGYALYRVKQDWQHGFSKGVVTIVEVVTPTPGATRELWRWLFDFDWTSEFEANLLPLDHPLFLLLAEPRRMQFTLNDGVWVRLIDVGGALSARTYTGEGEIVLELTDELLPENAGRWRVSAAGTERTEAAADLSLDITGLGTVYLGGFGFGDLVRASRAEELTLGAAARGDALFRTGVLPWCAEIF
ncbi:MAG TPA: GNAT family N-acetyltransferase [Gaiellaceae bacterium]|jgi:predicted acetyltransferase|nr:GNAT family N-acetyltransferase [Gaiellaceae bacterium]